MLWTLNDFMLHLLTTANTQLWWTTAGTGGKNAGIVDLNELIE
jgi:hypothetical protein